jgi:hypothetical protein
VLSGIAIAAAQNLPQSGGGGDKGAVSRDAAPSMKGSPQQGDPGGATDRRGGQGKAQTQGRGPQGKGQAAEQTEGRGDQGQPKSGQMRDKKSQAQGQKQQGKGQAQQQQKQQQQKQTQQKKQKDDKSQARTKRDKNEAQRGDRAKDQTVGQGAGQGAAKDGQQSKQQQGGQAQQKSMDQMGDARGRVTLSAEQRTRVRETVLARRDVPRVTRVDFALRVGIAVPARIRLVAVPAVLIDIHPEWRGHQFFVVRDEIVIVDRSRRIVAVVPAGPAQARGDVGGSGAAFVDLGPDDIRVVQLVLIERGLLVGEADGVFGPRTRAALVQFQRREGITVSGRIDARTVTALGVSDKIKAPSGSQPATTGQGQEGAQPSGKQPMDNKSRSSGQGGSQPSSPSTSGQGSDQSPSSKQGKGAQKNGAPPSTTGQGGRSNEAAPPASSGQGGQGGPPASKSPSSAPSAPSSR